MAASSQQPSVSRTAPPAIRKLDANVVNKIAAGEVIQRPSSALKEMLENSIDAGATQISILVKEGGNKLLQITDNGSGIRKEDLPILCHRHTTSKLREFEDLETIATLGFRGEALCSISFVSHMTVTTMARGAQYGYRVAYKDSEMEAPGPKPVASVPGTTITVEDLFYNVPTRRKALKSASEEYGLILDVLGRYAVYSTGVAFSCRRQGDARPDISTTATGSRLDAIRSVYGADVARELLPIKFTSGGGTGPEVSVDGPMGLAVEGLISGANYTTGKKTFLILFINGRSVESSPLRRALETLFGSLLPKAARPWLFLDVRLPPRQVEVNMHPTKREVGFMHQTEVIEEIRRAVETKLLASNESRTFAAATTATLQTQLPFATLPSGGVSFSMAPSQQPPRQQQQHQQQQQQIEAEEEEGCADATTANRGVANKGGKEGAEEAEDAEEEDEEDEEEEEDGGSTSRRKRARLRSSASAAGPGGGGGSKRPAAAAGAGGGGGGGGGGNGAPLPYRPEKLVRVDYRSGTLDAFVITQKNQNQAGSAAARAVAASGSVARRRSAAARLDGGGAEDPLGIPLATTGGGGGATAAGASADGGGAAEGSAQPPRTSRRRSGRALPHGIVTAEVLGLSTYGGTIAQAGADPLEAEVVETDPSDERVGVGGGVRAPPRRTAPAVATRDPVVLGLLSEAEAGSHAGLAEILKEHTFVGMADGSLALLQHGTRLYLVDVGTLSRDMMYQLALRRWEQPLRLALEPAPLVSELVELGLQVLQIKGEWKPEDGSPTELGELVTELLQQNRSDLERQLGLVVDSQGRLVSVPLLLEGLLPDPGRLPDLVLALAKDVDWDHPRERAQTIAWALADLYAARPPLPNDTELAPAVVGSESECMQGGKQTGGRAGAGGSETPAAAAKEDVGWEQRLATYDFKIGQVILPAMRGCLKPPVARATDGSCVQVAALERLYRIFERC